MLRALIVDDEPPARAELRYQLARHPDVQVVGEASNAREAKQLMDALPYDVVFLDVQMPGLNGLELAEEVHNGRLGLPLVVFVTAYDQYAIPAFDLSAVDYLLKPVEAERLAETVDRLRVLKSGISEPMLPDENGASVSSAEPILGYPQFVAGIDGEKTIPIRLHDVLYFAADGDTVQVYVQNRRHYPVRATLNALQQTLPAQMFFRCHRSYLVNVHQVSEIVPFFNGTFVLKMQGRQQEEIPVSRSNGRRLRKIFGFT